MPTRRQFLMTAALVAASPTVSPTLLARAEESEQPHSRPDGISDGIIDPFSWDRRTIPVSGKGDAGTEVIDDAVFDAMMEHGIVGCGVGVVRGARIVYAKGFGYSELPNTPFLPTTASRCGSVAKSITGLCALVLFDQGKLDLDAEILPILKDVGVVPRPVGLRLTDERLSKIRVRHLLDHTSGLPTHSTFAAWRIDRNVAALHHLDHVATAADVASDALGRVSLVFEPGQGFQYANTNFVLLARVIEAKSGMAFNDFLTQVAMPKFGVRPDEIYVSRNQLSPTSPLRGKNEAAYYQTSSELSVSVVPSEQSMGRIFGEAYRGIAPESSDGAGGMACTAIGYSKILANLQSGAPAISPKAIKELLTPPAFRTSKPDFDPAASFYSKGFDIRIIGGQAWISHGGMTLHCGGAIGHNAGFQFVIVSNWNNSKPPYVDAILSGAVGGSVGRIHKR